MFKDDNDTLLLCDKHKVLPLQRPCTVSSPSSWQTGRVAAHVKPYFLGKTLLKHARNESCNLQIYLYLSQWTFIFVGVFEQLSSRYFKINLLGLPLIFIEDKGNTTMEKTSLVTHDSLIFPCTAWARHCALSPRFLPLEQQRLDGR